MAPLKDILVLDFSTLLPGPMATLLMADAGARIVKVERPARGDEMRSYAPRVGEDSVNFSMLNRGKESIEIDLKDQGAKERLLPLLAKADVIIEQFRPGVMKRLGLGYEDIRKINPGIIYCSVTGWGQTGSKAHEAGHDLNYMAETGILGLSVGKDGSPILPPILAADIAGGAYPALINILLALRQRDRTRTGCWLDISMGENLFPFLYWALGNAAALQRWPVAGGERVTGGSARYQIYRTRDGRHLAAAPLEDKFWSNFTQIIGLPSEFSDDADNPERTRAAVADIIATRDASEWLSAFQGVDVCCSVVMSLKETLREPHWSDRATFGRQLELDGNVTIPALPSVISPELRDSEVEPRAPALGQANGL